MNFYSRGNNRFYQALIFFLILAISEAGYAGSLGDSLAIRMADSEMKRNPEAWSVDFVKAPKWNYTQGLITFAMLKVWQKTNQQKYFDYAKGYADKFIDSTGNIATYKMDEFSLDRVNSGKILFQLYKTTGDKKYMKALELLREQLRKQLRTPEGGFWHKKVYPNQMWLDGLYMATPFLAQYGKEFNDTAALNEAALQILLIQKHTYDSITGLNYHGWDESKQQAWANPVTGCSPNFWGRAQGWYLMAIVDMLDYLPVNHPKRAEIIDILNKMVKGIVNAQDPKSGVWYQVLDQGDRKGNYLESSASGMFVYGIAKAINRGYIPEAYTENVRKAWQGILTEFIRVNSDKTISITHVCAVAGLGGKPYRSGTFDYYIGEPVRDDDPKAVGPFILAGLQMDSLLKY